MSNIRDAEDYQRQFWDFTPYNDAFGGKIRLSDIDAFAERHGTALFVEFKKPGTEVPMGQAIAFDTFVRQGNTVMIVWGQRNAPEAWARWPVTNPEPCSQECLFRHFEEWYEWADGLPLD